MKKEFKNVRTMDFFDISDKFVPLWFLQSILFKNVSMIKDARSGKYVRVVANVKGEYIDGSFVTDSIIIKRRKKIGF